MAKSRLIGDYPVIGIRPTIDGRRGPLKVRESLEDQTMNMAKAAAKLFEENLKYTNGEPVKVIIADTTIGRVAESAACADKVKKAGVDITLTVTPCWCYGSETMDMDPMTIKGVWGFNGTERPGAVYLAAVLASHAQKGLPAFGIYGHDVQDMTDTSIPDDVKEKLKMVVDTLNNKSKYHKLGCNIAHGLLLYGPPGTGKTSIAKEIIKNAIGRKSYVIRKTKSDGDFMGYIDEVFMNATKNQPSIILLDDLDKFAEDDSSSNQEEYVAVQSLIDNIKNDDVFVIATANDYSILPSSLLRAGRFDIQIEIDNPKEEDAIKIFDYYLRKKKISKNVDIKKLSYILTDSSCAKLEKVCNQAGIYAGYKNKNEIEMEDLLRAALELKYKTNIENLNAEDKYSLDTAYHEAEHALIAEYLEPGSISFITIAKNKSNTKGITTYHQNEDYFRDITFMQNRVKVLLAGKAATEIVFNKCDAGIESDIDRAYNIVQRIINSYCLFDFNSYIYTAEMSSERVKENRDNNINKMIRDYYMEVRNILIKKRDLLDKLALELNNKKILFQDEIRCLINS